MRIELEIPDAILHQLLDGVSLPDVVRVRNEVSTPPGIVDIAEAVCAALARADARSLFVPGQRVAVAVGSRGISRLADIVTALIYELRAWQLEPFIVPAMGSHGGASAAGQKEVLARLGVTPDRVGAPIISNMETVIVGETADGMPVHVDRFAAAADAIVVVNRVKSHTAYRGPYESGLAKMIAIGLGKQAGAAATHARGFGEIARAVPAMAAVALSHSPIRFGLAVLENAREEPFKLEVLRHDRILEEEPALLEQARSTLARLPADALDVLVIDAIGKNISGDGADPNVTGRYPTPFASGGPRISKQVVLSLDDASDGNANGLGMADFTTVRAVRSTNLANTYPNSITSTVSGPVALPMILPCDRLAIAAAVLTCNAVGRPIRLARIANTLCLEELWLSEAALTHSSRDSQLHQMGDPQPMAFDTEGNLLDLAGSAVSR
jgi:hypothetical protein